MVTGSNFRPIDQKCSTTECMSSGEDLFPSMFPKVPITGISQGSLINSKFDFHIVIVPVKITFQEMPNGLTSFQEMPNGRTAGTDQWR